MGEILIYGGIAILGLSAAAGIVIFAVLWGSKRRLNAKLDSEYGRRNG